MDTYSDSVPDEIDPIHQLEVDLKEVVANPLRFPRTNKLIAAGAPQQAKKIVEEAAELAIEAIRSNRGAAVMEAADLDLQSGGPAGRNEYPLRRRLRRAGSPPRPLRNCRAAAKERELGSLRSIRARLPDPRHNPPPRSHTS